LGIGGLGIDLGLGLGIWGFASWDWGFGIDVFRPYRTGVRGRAPFKKMTLKWFHLVFIAASLMLTLIVAVWGFYNDNIALAMLSLAGGAALLVYRGKFLEKTRSMR
jgi:hypothetical protein